MECFRIDESGYTGFDLLSREQRFQGAAAIAISDEDAAQLIKEHFPKLQASELKYRALSRRPANHTRQRLLLMLDEFPALGRLDFFESALAFMAGYGIKAFLIAQSLNQIEKAYGQNNSILDNCHVRVSFATNDERTAKRVSDALGTATEMRAMKNYAGHRLSPWLGHLMVSRSETARALLTPGEIMQLPPDDEIVMVAGVHPVRAKKARYFQDRRLTARVLPAPIAGKSPSEPRPDDWSHLAPIEPRGGPLPDFGGEDATAEEAGKGGGSQAGGDADSDGVRREPTMERHIDIAPSPTPPPANEFDPDEPDTAAAPNVQRRAIDLEQLAAARRASLDPSDGIEL